MIQPAAWAARRQFCLQAFAHDCDPVLESDPARELAEEFADALGIHLEPSQYRQKPVGVIVQERPCTTGNLRAPGLSTARIYRIFEVHVLDAALSQAMPVHSERCSDDDFRQLTLADLSHVGRGRASAVLALPLERLTQAYLALTSQARWLPLNFNGHNIEANAASCALELQPE